MVRDIILTRNRWAKERLGDIDFDVTPLTLRPGGVRWVRFSGRPDGTIALNRATVQMNAEERVTRGSGINRSTYRQQVYSHETHLPETQQLPAGPPFHRAIAVPIHTNAPPFFIASDNHLDLTVRLPLNIPRRPDWSGECAILVHP